MATPRKPRETKSATGDYKDLYFEEKFRNVHEKLDAIIDSVGTKASSGSVARLETKVAILESSHIECPIMDVRTEVYSMKGQLQVSLDKIKVLEEVTEDIAYYRKRPNQFKMMVIGFCALCLLNVVTMLPTIYWIKKAKSDVEQHIQTDKAEQTAEFTPTK